jgi:magnesium-transporting ATPase (P-type)
VEGPEPGQFPSNSIQTARYNILSFLPVALIIQFSRLANVYFLIIAVLQSIPAISPFGPLTAWGPLIFVIGISLIREAIEDYARHRSDSELNSNPCVRFVDGRFQDSNWTDVRVGDFVRIEANEFFPADLLVMNSSNENGVCFI